MAKTTAMRTLVASDYNEVDQTLADVLRGKIRIWNTWVGVYLTEGSHDRQNLLYTCWNKTENTVAGGCLLCIDTLLCTQGFLIIKGLLDLYSVRLCTLSKAVLSSRTLPKNLSSSSTRNPVNARALATFIVWS